MILSNRQKWYVASIVLAGLTFGSIVSLWKLRHDAWMLAHWGSVVALVLTQLLGAVVCIHIYVYHAPITRAELLGKLWQKWGDFRTTYIGM